MVHIGPMIWEIETAIWERLMDVNLKSAFLCSKHVIKFMLEKRVDVLSSFPPGSPRNHSHVSELMSFPDQGL